MPEDKISTTLKIEIRITEMNKIRIPTTIANKQGISLLNILQTEVQTIAMTSLVHNRDRPASIQTLII